MGNYPEVTLEGVTTLSPFGSLPLPMAGDIDIPIWWLVVGALGSYLLGSFPTGVVLTKRKFGIDVRDMGSGNIGATNVTRVFGWSAGVLVFLLDFIKGALPVWIVVYPMASRHTWLVTVVGIGVVVGHCYSIFLRGRGGKGVATSFGCMSVLSPELGAITGLVYLAVLFFSKISALGSLAGLLTVLGYLIVVQPPLRISLLALCICAVVLIRHKSNIVRLIEER